MKKFECYHILIQIFLKSIEKNSRSIQFILKSIGKDILPIQKSIQMIIIF